MDEENSGRSLTSMAYERLREDVIGGQLKPSERLRIQSLTVRYGMGASAIREALSRLVTEKLVTSEDQRGFFVTPISRAELMDLTETRTWIEQTALRLAIENGSLEWESTILGCFHRLSRLSAEDARPEDAAAWKGAHRQFHFALLDGCGSAWTLKVCAELFDQTERYRNLSKRAQREGVRNVLKEHEKLMDAVLARNADKACDLMARHFRATTNYILEGDALSSERPGKGRLPVSAHAEVTPRKPIPVRPATAPRRRFAG